MFDMSDSKNAKKPTFTEEARRAQILDIALKLFVEKGFDGTSVTEIAKQAEVSRGVIFYYFDGKRELGEEVIRQNLREYSYYVQSRADKKHTGKAQLMEFVDACLDYIDVHRDNYLVYIDTIGRFGSTHEKNSLLMLINQRTRELLTAYIKRAQMDGDLIKTKAVDLADVLQAVIDGLQSLSSVDPDQVNIKNCKKLLKMIFAQALTPK